MNDTSTHPKSPLKSDIPLSFTISDNRSVLSKVEEVNLHALRILMEKPEVQPHLFAYGGTHGSQHYQRQLMLLEQERRGKSMMDLRAEPLQQALEHKEETI